MIGIDTNILVRFYFMVRMNRIQCGQKRIFVDSVIAIIRRGHRKVAGDV